MREQKRLKNSIQLKENLNPGSKSVCSEKLSGGASAVTDIGDLTQKCEIPGQQQQQAQGSGSRSLTTSDDYVNNEPKQKLVLGPYTTRATRAQTTVSTANNMRPPDLLPIESSITCSSDKLLAMQQSKVSTTVATVPLSPGHNATLTKVSKSNNYQAPGGDLRGVKQSQAAAVATSGNNALTPGSHDIQILAEVNTPNNPRTRACPDSTKISPAAKRQLDICGKLLHVDKNDANEQDDIYMTKDFFYQNDKLYALSDI